VDSQTRAVRQRKETSLDIGLLGAALPKTEETSLNLESHFFGEVFRENFVADHCVRSHWAAEASSQSFRSSKNFFEASATTFSREERSACLSYMLTPS
jgi:hypothetical protein